MIYTLSLDYDTICQKPFGKTFREFARVTLLCLVRGFISLHVPLFARALLHRENLTIEQVVARLATNTTQYN